MTRLLRLPATLERTGLGRSALYLRLNSGTWPRPVKVGPNLNGWFEHEIERMNAAAAAEYTDEQLRRLVQRIEAERAEQAAVTLAT